MSEYDIREEEIDVSACDLYGNHVVREGSESKEVDAKAKSMLPLCSAPGGGCSSGGPVSCSRRGCLQCGCRKTADCVRCVGDDVQRIYCR